MNSNKPIAITKGFLYLLLLTFFGCNAPQRSLESTAVNAKQDRPNTPFLVILGTAQDAGAPQIGCAKDCCSPLFDHPELSKQVVSLGLVNPKHNKQYIFEATPDIGKQLQLLNSFSDSSSGWPDGIFLTHAHIGHYTGLMYLGKEAIDSKKTPVFVMPRMKAFLTQNGPWDQLVKRNNILLEELKHQAAISITDSLRITPFAVPHRDEYAETVGYKIEGPNKSALFIPDIDKWHLWDKNIVHEVKKVDYAFLDATFYSGKELDNRDMSQIPHPSVVESMEIFEALSAEEKRKVVFIHFNHTNPLLDPTSEETAFVVQKGFRIAQRGDVFEL